MPLYYNEKPQPMIELKITWDGDVPGLSDHRLSVALFSKPLRHLLLAVRRTANNMLREGSDRKRTETGRVAAEADQIDIQIASIGVGSVDLGNVISVQVPPGQIGLWPEGLAADALDRLLGDIERESKGSQRSTKVRRYLESLPPGLSRQDYYLYVDGELKREVHLGALELPTTLDGLAYLIEIEGRVIGVGFEPGRSFVRIKSSDPSGTEVTLFATAEQVDLSLENKSEDVRVLAVVTPHLGKRLLRLQLRREQRVKLDEDTYIFEKWSNLLARLAQ